MQFELITRRCASNKCSNTFKVLEKDPQKFCSKFCQDNGVGVWNSSPAFVMTEKSGVTERIEVQSPLIEEEKQGHNGLTVTEKKKQLEKRLNALLIPKDTRNSKENITTRMPKSEMSKERNGERTTGSDKKKIIEIDTNDSKKLNEGKSMKEDSNANLPEVSNPLLMGLETERSSSLKLLNDASSQLLELAKSLGTPVRSDENNHPILNASSHNKELSIKALSEFRNMMNTKLAYIKFGHDLTKE